MFPSPCDIFLIAWHRPISLLSVWQPLGTEASSANVKWIVVNYAQILCEYHQCACRGSSTSYLGISLKLPVLLNLKTDIEFSLICLKQSESSYATQNDRAIKNKNDRHWNSLSLSNEHRHSFGHMRQLDSMLVTCYWNDHKYCKTASTNWNIWMQLRGAVALTIGSVWQHCT